MKGKHVNFLHIPGQGLGVLLIRIFIKTEIRSFWFRTPNIQVHNPRGLWVMGLCPATNVLTFSHGLCLRGRHYDQLRKQMSLFCC